MLKKQSKPLSLKVGARDSLLSRRQVEEIFSQMECEYEPVWMKTHGDLDHFTSLRDLGQTDFFTRELDEALLTYKVHVTIHSAKDLPDPLPEGVEMVALTQGIDPSDALVLREGEELKSGMVIGTSSTRREEVVSQLRDGLDFVDIRGTIRQRLDRLYERKVDGVVIAEAALIRLGLTNLNRIRLPGETAPLQGRLAVLARVGDEQMRQLFSQVHHDQYALSGA
ncbi:MAG: Porphobilinogen deaminase [Chlamydiales bacterium]|nr:Porphobilinogen deaminase [Chlamydiales bacterium]MCH9635479.1 Porphobilinogen deaminase [Chlamydiales bacterium]